MVKPRIMYTVADYMTTPDDKRYQLLEGELILAPSPTDRHQAILGTLFFLLYQYNLETGSGHVRMAPLDVHLSNYDLAQPDILFVSNDRASIITAANIQGAPDLVVEILSPSTERYDRGYKRTMYARYGVREYWLVDPDAETIEILTESDEGFVTDFIYQRDQILVSPLLPGLSIDLNRVFSV